MPSEAQRARQEEVYGSRLLMDLIEGREPNPDHLKWLAKDWEPSFRWAESGGSWNHWQILTAARLWLRADDVVISLILAYLRAQLGEQKTPAQPTLEFFGGTEQGSNTYEGWRWGCVLSWRLLALRFPDHPAAAEILRLTARYNEVQTALLALGASPRPTKSGVVMGFTEARKDGQLRYLREDSGVAVHANARGQSWWQGPSLPVSGNRSTPAHVGQDDRAPIYDWFRGHLGLASRDFRRFGWPNEILSIVITEEDGGHWQYFNPDSSFVHFRDALFGIRLLVPHHFAHWREEGIRANWITQQSNGNTTSVLGHVMNEHSGTATFLFPWPGRIRGRKGKEGPGEAWCRLDGLDDGLRPALVATSRFGEVSCELPDRYPDSHVVMGPEGLEVLR